MRQKSTQKLTQSHPFLYLFHYIKQWKSHFLWTCVCSVLNKILDLMPPVLVAWVIDTINHQPPAWIASVVSSEKPFHQAVFLAGLAIVIFGGESLFQWGYQYGFLSLAQNLQHTLRRDVYQSVQEREMAFFEDHRTGNTLSILNDDINQLDVFLNNGFNELLQLGVLFAFAGVVLPVPHGN